MDPLIKFSRILIVHIVHNFSVFYVYIVQCIHSLYCVLHLLYSVQKWRNKDDHSNVDAKLLKWVTKFAISHGGDNVSFRLKLVSNITDCYDYF